MNKYNYKRKLKAFTYRNSERIILYYLTFQLFFLLILAIFKMEGGGI